MGGFDPLSRAPCMTYPSFMPTPAITLWTRFVLIMKLPIKLFVLLWKLFALLQPV